MFIRDLIPKGPTIAQKMPTYGVYNNILMGDKRLGALPAAVAPFGKLNMTGENDKFELLEGVSPAVFMPMTAQMDEDVGEAFFNDFREMSAKMDELANNYWHWKKTDFTPEMRSASLPLDAFNERKEIHVLRDALYRYTIYDMADWIWYMTEWQDQIQRFRLGSTFIETKPVGLQVLIDKTDTSPYKTILPRRNLDFRDKVALRMIMPTEEYTMRLKREGYKWQLMVATCAARVYALSDKRPWNLTQEDFMAWAAYTIGAYSRFDASIDDQIRYTGEDLLQDTLSYLGLPFSDIWPDISLDDKQSDDMLERLKWIIMLNLSLAIAGKRVGGKVTPIKYLLVNGNIHLLKAIIPMYLQSPLNMGGGDTMWMHPATNTSVPFGVLFPSIVYKGTNTWETSIPEKHDSFNDMVVDRGQIDIPTLDALNANYRLISSRDGRVQQVVERGRQYTIVVHKILPNGYRRTQTSGEEFLLSYISDPTMKFGPAVFVSSSMGRKRYDITLGPSPIMSGTPLGDRKPMPGGIVDTDAGTLLAVAQPATPKDADAAEKRTTDAEPDRGPHTPMETQEVPSQKTPVK